MKRGDTDLKHLSKRQRTFLHDCLLSGQTFNELLEKHQLTELRLRQWLKNKFFRLHLRHLRMILDLQRELEIALASSKAALLLRQAMEDAKVVLTESQARAAESLIRVVRKPEEQRPPSKRSRSIVHCDRMHPDLSPQEKAELLRAMDESIGQTPATADATQARRRITPSAPCGELSCLTNH